MLKNKKILLGVTGGIAAYKIPLLVRLLKKARAEVRVLMTKDACEFVTPLTLSTLSGEEVAIEFYPEERNQWNNHVDLALWADVFCIAPLTANTLAKLAWGMSDNLLSAVFLSAKCPVLVAPAMDRDMYQHPATQYNLHQLHERGTHVIPAGKGFLASGLHGEGRMAEPEEIFNHILSHFASGQELIGKKVVVTAGPTFESLDPVRFIGNYSTGKMGLAIAEALAEHGADVVLVCGPIHLDLQASEWHSNIRVEKVISSDEMAEYVFNEFVDADACVMTAAVADYKPKNCLPEKIKKGDQEWDLTLIKTTDILKELGQRKRKDQVLVGFALETENELEHARRKVLEKKVDFLVMNSLNDPGAGFGVDTNKVTFINEKLEIEPLPLLDKKEVGKKIAQRIITIFESKKHAE